MNEQQTTQEPKKRTNKVAEEKARLRAELETLANKVPAAVNAGGILTTRRWVGDNKKIVAVAGGGKQRMSRRALQELLGKAKEWHEAEAA